MKWTKIKEYFNQKGNVKIVLWKNRAGFVENFWDGIDPNKIKGEDK